MDMAGQHGWNHSMGVDSQWVFMGTDSNLVACWKKDKHTFLLKSHFGQDTLLIPLKKKCKITYVLFSDYLRVKHDIILLISLGCQEHW